MAIQSGGQAPYAPPQTVLSLIHAYRNRGLQTPFDASVLVRAGISESLVPRTLQAMRLLDLVDEGGNPMPALEGLRRAGASEYHQRLEEIVRAAYSEVFLYVDPAEASEEDIRSAFRAYDPIGQLTRMVRLFLALCAEAKIIPPEKAKTSSKGGGGRVKNAKPKTAKEKPAKGKAREAKPTRDSGVELPEGIPPAVAGLIASMPRDGESWSALKKAKFMDTLKVVLDFAYTEPDATEPDDDAEWEDE